MPKRPSENEIITKYAYLVTKIAKSFRPHTSADLEDYKQCGFIGLINASRKYTGQSRFSTFAWNSIRWEIIRFLNKENKHKYPTIDNAKTESLMYW